MSADYVLRNRHRYVDALLGASDEDLWSGLVELPPEAHTRYKFDREPLEAALKEASDAGNDSLWRLYIVFEGTAFDFAMECFRQGFRRGAMAEEFRRHLLTVMEGCTE